MTSGRVPLGGGGRRLELQLAWRFLGGGRRNRLLGGTALSALAATSLGVCAMVIAMALMTGYRHDLERKLSGGAASIVAYPLLAESPGEGAEALLDGVPGIDRVSRVAYGQGSLASRAAPDGVDVTLRGVADDVELGSTGRVEPLADGPPPSIARDAAGPAALPGVVLGRELERRLAPGPDEPLRLMVLGFRDGRPRFAYRTVEAVGTLVSGLSEFDRRLVLLDRQVLTAMTGAEPGPGLIEIRLTAGADSRAAVERIEAALGSDYLVRDWRELNRPLFDALELQQLALFFVLGLIVLVSTFNVASSLVVLVRERMREIGVLAALGLEPKALRRVFLLFGGAIGLGGTSLGVAAGWGIATILTRFELIRFDAEVAEIYFLSAVSFRVEPLDVAAVVLFTLAVTFAACWLPARRAAVVRPAAALRYE